MEKIAATRLPVGTCRPTFLPCEVQLRYTPFDIDLNEISQTDLATLREVSEGWYVEYKSEVTNPRSLAKSLSSFANRYGGWLILGVQEDPKDHTAASFPGVPNSDLTSILQQLRDAAKDLLQPTVPFFHHILTGPLADISLPSGRTIIVVRIPEGASTPYVHNDGHIYIRTGDSSSPVVANDRATIDQLHRKADERKTFLEDFIYRVPVVSKGEDSTTFIHLALCSDPFQVLGHWYSGSFTEFSEVMRTPPLPFDNIYTSQDGFVARQAEGTERWNRLFTWEFFRNCNSFVTLPQTSLEVPSFPLEGAISNLDQWSQYAHGEKFVANLTTDNLKYARVLNLNTLVSYINGIVIRHRSLASLAGIHGPFFLKARIDNTWRVVPFLDISEFISHTENFGIPVVQDSNLTAPSGKWPEGFITITEESLPPVENEFPLDGGAIKAWIAILQALGIPGDFLARHSRQIADLANRETERHRRRLAIPSAPPRRV